MESQSRGDWALIEVPRLLRGAQVVVLILGALGPAAARAQTDSVVPDESAAPEIAARQGETGLPLPRFVTLRAPEVNLRTGPGARYPIEWVYRLRGLPFEVIEEFETWRRVRDWQGTEGWVHQSMLSGERGALVIGAERLLRRTPRANAPGVARVRAGVVGALRACRDGWCRIEVKGFDGWLPQDEFYGAYPGEHME